jgi:hypothetical protein
LAPPPFRAIGSRTNPGGASIRSAVETAAGGDLFLTERSAPASSGATHSIHYSRALMTGDVAGHCSSPDCIRGAESLLMGLRGALLTGENLLWISGLLGNRPMVGQRTLTPLI